MIQTLANKQHQKACGDGCKRRQLESRNATKSLQSIFELSGHQTVRQLLEVLPAVNKSPALRRGLIQEHHQLKLSDIQMPVSQEYCCWGFVSVPNR